MPNFCSVVPPTADDAPLALAFAALSNPHRLLIYRRLLRQPAAEFYSCMLQGLVDQLEIGAPTVSHHIKILEQAGLIQVQRVGRALRCQLDLAMHAQLQHCLQFPLEPTR